MRRGTAWLVRLVGTVVGVLVVASFLLFVDLGGTIGRPGFSVRSLIAIALFSIPFLVYLSLVKTVLGSVVGGIGLIGAAVVLLVALLSDEHSTAGIGIFTIPVGLVLGVFGVVLLEGFASAMRRRPPPGPRSE